MVRRIDIIMALDGILYDADKKKEYESAEGILEFTLERINNLKKRIELERKYNENKKEKE